MLPPKGTGGVTVKVASKVGLSHRSVIVHVTVTLPPEHNEGIVWLPELFEITGLQPPLTLAWVRTSVNHVLKAASIAV